MAKKEAFLQFLKAARSLQDRGLSKEAIVQFAKNEFGELSELFKKQIDSLFKPKKGIENRPILSGNFANQPSTFLYNLNPKKEKFKNAQVIEDLGFFIGLHTQELLLKDAKYLANTLLKINRF